MKKKYVVVGSNNFWYLTTGEVTKKELNAEIKTLRKQLQNGEWADEHSELPDELYVYEATEVKRIDLFED